MFLREYSDVISPEACKLIIESFESDDRKVFGGVATKETIDTLDKKQKVVQELYTDSEGFEGIDNTLFSIFGKYLNQYISDIGIESFDGDKLFDEGYKIKKYSKGGFHNWHHDNKGSLVKTRMLAAIIYLNDVDRGGETEFKYQNIKIKPEQGKMIIFPTNWMYYHRGCEPLSNNKYAVTTFFRCE